MTRPDFLPFFTDLAYARARSESLDWFRSCLDPSGSTYLPGVYARITRKMGKDGIVLSPVERSQFDTLQGKDVPFNFRLDEAFRTILFLHSEEQYSERNDLISLAEDLFYRGDNEEKRALLRALPFTKNPEIFQPIATEACRTNVVSVFSGIACESKYPYLYFSELEFNQMIIKGMTLGLPLERVYGWRERNNGELCRMSLDYIREREAAGRSYPEGNRLIVDDYRSKNEIL